VCGLFAARNDEEEEGAEEASNGDAIVSNAVLPPDEGEEAAEAAADQPSISSNVTLTEDAGKEEKQPAGKRRKNGRRRNNGRKKNNWRSWQKVMGAYPVVSPGEQDPPERRETEVCDSQI